MRPINEWIFVIAGFTQMEGEPDGWTLLWREMNKLSSDYCQIEFKRWHQNWSDIAELVRLFSDPLRPPTVKIFGYSFGGYSAVLLARELKRRDIEVRSLFLADAVYRASWLLGWWRSMMSWPRIIVPDNVAEVIWFRQRNPRFALKRDGNWCNWQTFAQPAGHDVLASNPQKTKIHPPLILNCEHVFVDDNNWVRSKALSIAEAA